jgi:hypothetical protein
MFVLVNFKIALLGKTCDDIKIKQIRPKILNFEFGAIINKILLHKGIR